MSALTIAVFAASVGIFLFLLGTVVYMLVAEKYFSSNSDAQIDGSTAEVPTFSCAVEVVILDDHLQITNTDEQQIRLDGPGLGRGLRLVTEDQLQLTLQPDVNVYRMYSMETGEDEADDKQFMQIKVSTEFVEVKPVLKFLKQRMEIIIWKMKPYTVRTESQLAERQVFCGFLQKTVHFERSQGKYFKGPQTRLASFICQSNTSEARRHRLLTLRVHPDRVMAVNQSSLPMHVVVRQRSESLKRRLSREMQDLPLNGTFSFSLLTGNSSSGNENGRKALRLHLNERQLLVEPHSKFGSLPLSCEVYLPDREGDSPTQIVSGEFMSPLQLPRGPHRYIISFYLHMKNDEIASGPARFQCYSNK
uniref:TMEM132 domain-containing protein n=1 Tax=Macrostomum lignano TaxID=282301 RepID=A0A1I8GPV6_9PLAT